MSDTFDDKGINIPNIDNQPFQAKLLSGKRDPSEEPGVRAPAGSLYVQIGIPSQLFIKDDNTITGWSLMAKD